ncbi:MAG: tetratricopeptide repeat protein, partial [Nannocystaceae bacterium]|nr:tetratricopeptide repeat protein [Nannocystaceae bacterium]
HRRTRSAVLEVLRAAGRGLADAHRAGLLHRDFKPDNVMVAPLDDDRPEQVRVTDFGLAALLEEAVAAPGVDGDRNLVAVSLHTQGVVGTVGYMAPEQIEGGSVGPAADQFAFCVTAWEALAGVRPFAGETVAEVLAAASRGPRRELPGAQAIGRTLRQVLLRGLAIDPAARHADMDALLAALAREPWRAARRGFAFASVAGALWWFGRAPQPCAGIDDAMLTLWHTPRAEQLAQAFADTGVAGAEQAWTTVAARVDRQAQAWIAASRSSCEAHARGEWTDARYDATTACLDRRRAQLASTLEVFATADTEVVHRSLLGLTEFDPVASCEHAERVLAGPEPPAPAVAAAVATARERLAAAQANERAGRFAQAHAVLDEIEAERDAVDYPPVAAELALRRGAVLVKQDRFDDGRVQLEQAFFSAVAADERGLALEAATALIFCVGYRLARYDEGALWVRHAQAHEEAATTLQRASIMNNEGAMLRARGDPQGALARYEQVLALRREVAGAAPDASVAAALNNVGLALDDLSRHDEAIAALRESLAIRRTVLGPDHPEVAEGLANLSKALVAAGNDDEGERELLAAIALRERIFGPEHVSIARALVNLSIIDQHRERPAVAVEHLERAQRIFEHEYGASSPLVATVHHNLSSVLIELGRQQEGLQHAEQAYAQRRVKDGENALLTLQSRSLRAEAMFALGRTDEALAEQREIVRLDAAARGAESPSVAIEHGALGRMLALLGRHEEAIAELELAAAIHARVHGPDHPRTRRAAKVLAEARAAQAAAKRDGAAPR